MRQLLWVVNMGRSWYHIIGRTPAAQNTYVVSLGHILCPILFESVYVCLHTNPCILIVFLECDPDQCVLDIPVGREDQTLIATRAEGSCCLAHICSKSLRLML